MAGRIQAVEAAIVEALTALEIFQTVEAFTGEVFDVAERIKRRAVPAALVAYAGIARADVGGGKIRPVHQWAILVGDATGKALQDDARAGSLDGIERAIWALHEQRLGGAEDGPLVFRYLTAVERTERQVIWEAAFDQLARMTAPA